MYPDSIKSLIESFKFLPGIGEKTAERLAFSVLELEEEQVDMFSESLVSVKNNIHKCSCCNTLTENDINDYGILCINKNGTYHIGETYFNNTYKKSH